MTSLSPAPHQTRSQRRARATTRLVVAVAVAVALAAATAVQARQDADPPADDSPADAPAVVPANAPADGPAGVARNAPAAGPHGTSDVFATFADGCVPVDPDLAWFSLPRALRAVPIEAMVGQLLVVSFTGTRIDDPTVEETRAAIARGEIGGVLYFRHNIASAQEVAAVNVAFARAHPELPAMVAIDQEGGLVMRLKPSEGAPDTPSARNVAATSPADAARAYRQMATHLAALGFTDNFGPVVDLSVNPDNPVIDRFGRSYGATPRTVVRYARAFIDAHRAAGIGTALKHFPGHGSSNADSHAGAIDLTGTWSPQEMIPFRDLIASGEADMVMAGHLQLDGLTGPGDLPASLSPRALEGFLRETLCFAGVVVSDDLAMAAIDSRWGTTEAVRMMIEAGGDIALLSLPVGKGLDFVRGLARDVAAAARESPVLATKVRQAYARVVHHKLDLARARALAGGPHALSDGGAGRTPRPGDAPASAQPVPVQMR